MATEKGLDRAARKYPDAHGESVHTVGGGVMEDGSEEVRQYYFGTPEVDEHIQCRRELHAAEERVAKWQVRFFALAIVAALAVVLMALEIHTQSHNLAADQQTISKLTQQLGVVQ